VLDWSKLPDLAAVALLTSAFASVASSGHKPISRLWLSGWVMIAVHFAATMFLFIPGFWGTFANILCVASLVDAGVLFMYASVPYRREISSRRLLACLLATNTLYVSLLVISPSADWALTPIAILFGVAPLTTALLALRNFQHPLRWIVVALYIALSIFLLAVQHRPGNGTDLALNAVLFTVYFGCCLHVWRTYNRATTGAFITIAGFLTWSSVFVVGPGLAVISPNLRIESEVWNLPKYVVAVGMILLLLEDQLEHNKYLALHDELTGLPNRRLFLDRLAQALERSRRAGTKTALLVVDLDRFKQVNDSLGHHAGDLLLQQVGTLFTGRVRGSDTVARTGGDEFSVILEDAADRLNATQVAQSLLSNLNSPLQVDGRSVLVGASIGIALYPDDAADMESLRIAADLRMYDDKHDHRDSPRRTTAIKIPPQSEVAGNLAVELGMAPGHLGN